MSWHFYIENPQLTRGVVAQKHGIELIDDRDAVLYIQRKLLGIISL